MSASGTGLAEARRLYEALKECEGELKQVEAAAVESRQRINELILTANALVSVFRRMGLPEDIEQAISTIQRLIMVINMAKVAVMTAMAATTPAGMAYAAVGIMGVGLTIYNEIDMMRRSQMR